MVTLKKVCHVILFRVRFDRRTFEKGGGERDDYLEGMQKDIKSQLSKSLGLSTIKIQISMDYGNEVMMVSDTVWGILN
jgi:hypothetical protein